jgi:hypothetical protein
MTRTRYSAKADRRPTWTSLTVEALRVADDFLNMQQLMAAIGANGNQMRATLHHLKRTRVVDAMESDGVLWFYLTGEDKRSMTVQQRVPEPKGNRTRVGKLKPKMPPAE